MNAFERIHPYVLFAYFLSAIFLSSFVLQPIFAVCMLVCSVISAFAVVGGKFGKSLLFPILPAALLGAVINPLFNHGGATVLAYFPSGNPLTLESILFGVSMGAMLVSVMAWFSCFNAVMTSDKLMCVFARLSPSVSLVLSMVLRFVPRFSKRLSQIRQTRDDIMGEHRRFREKLRGGIDIFLAMLTWSLENAVITSDSMLARGYGTSVRTSYSNYTFSRRDAMLIVLVLLTFGYAAAGMMLGKLSFSFFPSLSEVRGDIYSFSLYADALVFGLLPLSAELLEVRKWRV